MSDEVKGKPIPTRFDPPETDAIKKLQQRTGLPAAEIVRRAVRLLSQRVEAEGGGVGFILDELSPRVAEESNAYGKKKSEKK